MRPNAYCTFPLPNFDVLADAGYISIPRSDLFTIRLNPFDGNAQIAYQRHPDSMAFVDYVLEQYKLFADSFMAKHHRSCRFADFVRYCETGAM